LIADARVGQRSGNQSDSIKDCKQQELGRTPGSTVSRTWHSIKNDLRHADELAQNENGQYATSAAAHLKLLIGERHVSLMFTPPFSISK
jgi:hypothetical protein